MVPAVCRSRKPDGHGEQADPREVEAAAVHRPQHVALERHADALAVEEVVAAEVADQRGDGADHEQQADDDRGLGGQHPAAARDRGEGAADHAGAVLRGDDERTEDDRADLGDHHAPGDERARGLVGVGAGQPVGVAPAHEDGQAGAEHERRGDRPPGGADGAELDQLGVHRVPEARSRSGQRFGRLGGRAARWRVAVIGVLLPERGRPPCQQRWWRGTPRCRRSGS